MFSFLFLAPYARTTRYEEAFPWKTKEKKARLARPPHDNLLIPITIHLVPWHTAIRICLLLLIEKTLGLRIYIRIYWPQCVRTCSTPIPGTLYDGYGCFALWNYG